MASIDTYLGFQWGVDKLTLTENDGLVQPQLVSAVSTDPNTIRVTFDVDMMFLETPTSVLKPKNWAISETISGDPLDILWITKVSDTVVDIHTASQKALSYDLLVHDVVSAWDLPIDLAADTDTFAGNAEIYPAFATMRAFFGLDVGMQGERVDVSAPYPENQDPFPTETGVLLTKTIEFDLLDAESNVDLTTVEIWVEGNKVYDGATDTFLSGVGFDFTGSTRTPVVGPPAGHHFDLVPDVDWSPFDTISTRVYAEDAIGFTLDVTWSFRTEDNADPYIDTISPTGNGVSKTAAVSFSAHDDESGIDSATLGVTIAGSPAITAGVFQAGFTGSITPDGSGGYNVVINKTTDYPSFTGIAVAISVKDNEGNNGTSNWLFTIEDYFGCLVTPISPTVSQIDYPTTGNVTIQVEDQDLVIAASLKVEIDYGFGYEIAFEYAGVPQFKPGWDGPASDVSEAGGVYTIVIDPTSDFSVGSTILVRVTASDPTGNPERLP